jgi:hypothetical protein
MQTRLVQNTNILDIASKHFFSQNGLTRAPKNLDEIILVFEKLRDGIARGDISALLIGKYIYENITAKEIRTLRVTAYDFEDFLTKFFIGTRMSESWRKKKSEKITGFADDYSSVILSSPK